MNQEKRRFIHSLIFPVFFLFIIWFVKLAEFILDYDLSDFGIFPHKISGLMGILTSPLIHKDFNHLASNTVPFLTLAVGVFYFYNKIAYKIFFLLYFLSGIWVWFGGREAYHIGASGLIYGLSSFLFFSGIFKNDVRLLAISLLVVFLYGSMVWGVLPFDARISWESHLAGMTAGMVLAFYFRRQGPEKVRYDWEDEQEDDPADEETSIAIRENNHNLTNLTGL
jgi:membrane associated rhomboid family serine protease